MSLTKKSSFSCIHSAQTSPSHLQPYTTWFNALENNNAYLIHKTPVTSILTYIKKLCYQYFSRELKHKRVVLSSSSTGNFSFVTVSQIPSISISFSLFSHSSIHCSLISKKRRSPLIECKIQKRLEFIRVKFWFLPFESVKRILWCYHSNEPSLAVLSYGMYLFFRILQNEIIKLDFDFGQLFQWKK